MARKIMAILLILSLCACFAVPIQAAEENAPLEVQLKVHSNLADSIDMDGLYRDNVLYIPADTVCMLTGASCSQNAQGDTLTFTLHQGGRQISVTPANGGWLTETPPNRNATGYMTSIPCIYYDEDIYVSATHLLRYMGAVVGFGLDETSETHMTVQMPYTFMDLIAEGLNSYAFQWSEAGGWLLQQEEAIYQAAVNTVLFGYDANVLAYILPSHGDKVLKDYYTDLLKEILRSEGAELSQSGYSAVEHYGNASNVAGISASWIKESLEWIREPELISNVNKSFAGAMDMTGLLLNVGGDYLKTLDTAVQFANMTVHQQELLDGTLNSLSQTSPYRTQLPQLFEASQEVGAMIRGDYSLNKTLAWNSIYSFLVNASTSAMNSVNPFSLAWDSFVSISKMIPLINDFLTDEKCIIFAVESLNLQTIARDLLSQDLSRFVMLDSHMSQTADLSVQYQEAAQLDIILMLKSALTARCMLLQTDWLNPAEQQRMEAKAVATANLLQKAQNAKPVVHTGVENRDEDLRWIEKLAKYKVAYANFLRDPSHFSMYDQLRFQLVYVDEDQTPELAVSDGSFHFTGVTLYTYYDGEVVELDFFGEFGGMSYAPKENMMLDEYGGQGGWSCRYYQWIDQQLVQVRQIEQIYGIQGDQVFYTYFVDGEESTQEAVNAVRDQMAALYSFEQITYEKSADVTEENIRKMLKNEKDFIALG